MNLVLRLDARRHEGVNVIGCELDALIKGGSRATLSRSKAAIIERTGQKAREVCATVSVNDTETRQDSYRMLYDRSSRGISTPE